MIEKKERKVNTYLIVALFLSVGFILMALVLHQVKNYEKSVLQVYADQQDSYVQLVLEQIYLVDDRDSEEIVSKIIGTLDTSSNKHWTLAESDSMVFVKDVTETNKFRGFTTETYYVSDSAKAFIDNLSMNKVKHSFIEMNDEEYIASGVRFEYNGANYKICLLTNTDIVLDHNAYLSAKTNVSLLGVLLFVLLIISNIFFGIYTEKWYKKYKSEKEIQKELRLTVNKLSEELGKDSLYDTRYMLFGIAAMPGILKKLEDRNAFPLSLAFSRCSDADSMNDFLAGIATIFGRNVFRFKYSETDILFIGIKEEFKRDDFSAIVEQYEAKVLAFDYIEEMTLEPLEEHVDNFCKKAVEDGEHTVL